MSTFSRIALVCFLVLPCCVFLIDSGQEDEIIFGPDSPEYASFRNHRHVFASLANADQVMIYEGLPHQNQEHQVYKQEVASSSISYLFQFPFYRNAIQTN